MDTSKLFFMLGSASAGLAVALGAFGAHALKTRLAPDMLAVYETGVRYQLTHALALLTVAWALTRWPGPATTASGWLFVAGTLLFCGSLVALALTGVRGLGAITPIGGAAWLVGWGCLVWGGWGEVRSQGDKRAEMAWVVGAARCHRAFAEANSPWRHTAEVASDRTACRSLRTRWHTQNRVE